MTALNDSGAIKSMDAREDGVYITYVPTVGADTVTKKLGSGISFRWKYAGQPNIIRGTTQQISEIDVSNYTFATFAVYTNSANLDINILGNGATISSFKTGTQKLDINEYTSISANFAVNTTCPQLWILPLLYINASITVQHIPQAIDLLPGFGL